MDSLLPAEDIFLSRESRVLRDRRPETTYFTSHQLPGTEAPTVLSYMASQIVAGR